ncbi:MAG: transglycosylase domain-containing protein [Candidatus Riflebacteria bacterium]|nr:transglycosylase domain-containing protein [Candidatus Riflebacteria bacterium]
MKQRLVRAGKWLLVAGLIASACVAGYYAWVIAAAREHTRTTVIPMIDQARMAVTVASLTPRQLEILLKVEDPTFFQHSGVDFTTPGQGITTITQGLVKILYFDHFQPGIAKISQTLIARFALDPLVGKNDQLRLYLNLAWFGVDGDKKPVIGFAEAAAKMFGKRLDDLDETEFMALVGTLIAPAIFSPLSDPAMSSERTRRIGGLVRGEYAPKGLFDLYYGPIPAEVRDRLPPMSYFESYYH